MADEYKRINLLIGTQVELAAGQEEGMPGIVSDSAYRLGVYAAGAWRLMALRGGSETFSALSISGLTNGAIPLVSTAGGLLGNSSLSEDATSVKIAKMLTANNAPTPGWGASWKPIQVSKEFSAVGAASQSYMIFNAYHDGSVWRAITSATIGMRPTLMVQTSSGGFEFYGSAANPVAGDPITDFTRKWYASNNGQICQNSNELVTSSRYVKTTDTTIGPSAAAKASLLNGATTGFTAATDPAQRWDAVGAKSKTELEGVVSSSANQVLVFELYRNGAVSATLTVPARTYGTNTAWRLVIKQAVRVAGASGTVRVLMRLWVTADNANGIASVYPMDVTLTGVDLTASHTWDVVCTIPNNASNQITCQDAEKIG